MTADLGELLPSFQPLARKLLEAVAARGYTPMPRSTSRTRAQAAANVARGTGIADSMHLYGAAMDVICGVHWWDCKKHRCGFFDVLGEEAERLGLTWGGRWTRGGKGPDMPHVQCLTVAQQPAFRALKTEAERDAFVAARVRWPIVG